MRAIDADTLITQIVTTTEEAFMNASWKQGMTYALGLVETQPTIQPEPHWIPVTERLPAMGKSVLICDAYGDICLGHRTQCGYYYPDFCDDKVKDVRAWCELPEPYKGVTE